MSSTRLTLVVALLSASALAACSDATGAPSRRAVSLSFSTSPGAAATAGMPALVAGELVVTRAQVVLSEVELELAGASCPDSGSRSDDDCHELKSGPMLVDLPLDGTTRTSLTVTIPEGRYEEFEVEVDAVSSDDGGRKPAAAAFLAAHPDFRDVSVRVEGTFNGQPFVFITEVDEELEIEFEPPMLVDASNNNLTVNIDVASWFRGADGAIVDPRTANAGGANKSRVDGNIKRSIRVFEDDDRDGHRDD